METDDDSLARAAATGDRTAFATLLARHFDRIFGLAWRLTGTRAEAQDLTQDICAALPARLPSWRGEARFPTWLYRVTVNAAHDLRRRQATRTRAADGWGDWELARRQRHRFLYRHSGRGAKGVGRSTDLRTVPHRE
ncbi:MAG: sigma-70 family RNA polymerase sigma factor [Candidatus Saccharibacteria bacterium]|nr:sigma-70 family RNA polymerase sigma factor [Pseudorhodobacter sp.]